MAQWFDILQQRKHEDNYRELTVIHHDFIDFQSNDYLGFARNNTLHSYWLTSVTRFPTNGSSGSRLISGNSYLYHETEDFLATYYQTENSLVVASGYMANLAFFSSIPQKNDVVLYDEFIHASIREGLRLNFAQKYSFRHNDYNDLEKKIIQNQAKTIYVVTEGIFSMDGDIPCHESIYKLQEKYDFQLVIDEAHSTGILGQNGKGWHEDYKGTILARIHTFGKALGIHGAAIVCSEDLKAFLVNFSKPIIYTTAMSHDEIMKIKLSHEKYLEFGLENRKKLIENIVFFNKKNTFSPIFTHFVTDYKAMEDKLHDEKLAIKIIKSPTVPLGTERLRICLHSYNTYEEIRKLKSLLQI